VHILEGHDIVVEVVDETGVIALSVADGSTTGRRALGKVE
jgi:hypothetical protein